ncbi:transposase [Rheinheimera salexigens]|uniref:Transposase IS200-like domain-containing protein n=1 Tax=Rheinheimera salexigens TaxID=1628148 RepID=A0A1E7Q4D5_9GAMM|nr:transposase [Rheinheimera salexigens]OEY68908.1 hypothetical protein BI198_04500 [Rheinheimera salexigens]
MPRSRRICVANIPQHVIQRGNNKQDCFIGAKDYHLYLIKLAECAEQYQVQIHAYVLMTNHVHLLLTPLVDGATSLFMQALGRCYVRYFNIEHKRTGTLWEGRYKACLVESDRYFLAVSRYIELNPVRAGMVANAADYAWSSFMHNALGTFNPLLTAHPVYLGIAENKPLRLAWYQQLFQQQTTNEELAAIRAATNRCWLLGSEQFSQQLSQKTGLQIKRASHGGDRRSFKGSESLKD